jgi:hypothetical protein
LRQAVAMCKLSGPRAHPRPVPYDLACCSGTSSKRFAARKCVFLYLTSVLPRIPGLAQRQERGSWEPHSSRPQTNALIMYTPGQRKTSPALHRPRQKNGFVFSASLPSPKGMMRSRITICSSAPCGHYHNSFHHLTSMPEYDALFCNCSPNAQNTPPGPCRTPSQHTDARTPSRQALDARRSVTMAAMHAAPPCHRCAAYGPKAPTQPSDKPPFPATSCPSSVADAQPHADLRSPPVSPQFVNPT